LCLKIINMISKITEFLTSNPSYLKKGDEFLAEKFSCSPRTISRIKTNLKEVKRKYLRSLAY
jgi:hypothetical protein